MALGWWVGGGGGGGGGGVDGASRQIGAGISLQLISLAGEKIKQAIHLGFNASNNELE